MDPWPSLGHWVRSKTCLDESVQIALTTWQWRRKAWARGSALKCRRGPVAKGPETKGRRGPGRSLPNQRSGVSLPDPLSYSPQIKILAWPLLLGCSDHILELERATVCKWHIKMIKDKLIVRHKLQLTR